MVFSISETFPQVSRSVLYEIVTERLNYPKLCSRWVPSILTEALKIKGLGKALTFLEYYDADGDYSRHDDGYRVKRPC